MSEKPFDLSKVIDDAKSVITTPLAFYKNMPVSGGYSEPAIFVLVMGFVVGCLNLLFSVFAGNFGAAIGSFLIGPFLIVLFSFVAALIMFVLWKLMGTAHDYETAYRCVAYTMAAQPVMAILGVIPFLGPVIVSLWAIYLIYIASVEVHKVDAKMARIVLGVIALVMVISGIGAQRATTEMAEWAEQTERELQHVESDAERIGRAMEELGKAAENSLPDLEKMEELTPEEQGRAVGEFFKGLQEGLEKQNDDKQ